MASNVWWTPDMWHEDCCPVDNCGIFWQAVTLLSAGTVGDRQIVTWDTILAQKLNAFTTAQTKEAGSEGKICLKNRPDTFLHTWSWMGGNGVIKLVNYFIFEGRQIERLAADTDCIFVKCAAVYGEHWLPINFCSLHRHISISALRHSPSRNVKEVVLFIS